MIYADTNFFMAFYTNNVVTDAARKLFQRARDEGRLPLMFTRLQRLELINGIEQWVFFSRSSQQTVFNQQSAQAAQGSVAEDAMRGVIVRAQHVDERQVDHRFEELSLRWSSKHGFRAYDVLHVAQAQALGCDTFWSFDAKARKLATLEGLKVNPIS